VGETERAAQDFSETQGTKESGLAGHCQRADDSTGITVSSPSDTGEAVSNEDWSLVPAFSSQRRLLLSTKKPSTVYWPGAMRCVGVIRQVSVVTGPLDSGEHKPRERITGFPGLRGVSFKNSHGKTSRGVRNFQLVVISTPLVERMSPDFVQANSVAAVWSAGRVSIVPLDDVESGPGPVC
jgi:hypothetical protein